VSYDLHRHVWPEPLVDALRQRGAPPYLRDDTLVLEDGEYPLDPRDYSPERCLESIEGDGIDVAVASCPPTLGIEALPPEEGERLLDAYHDGMREAMARAEGRLRGFAMGRVEDGFAGATLPAAALLDLDRAAPLLDELERRRAVLFVHPGPSQSPADAPAWWGAAVGYTGQMQAAYAAWLAHGVHRWPELRVLFAILAGGAPIQLERMRSRGFDVREALVPTVYFDTASYGRRAFELCLATFGGANLVFGSDGPVIDSKPTLDAVRNFGQAVTDAVCTDNPRELLS
jgi:hypothetical protein